VLATEGNVVEVLKAAAVLGMALCCALPARSATDCNPIEKMGYGDDTHAVIAYIDTSAVGASASEVKKLQRDVQDTVLLNYLTSLGVALPKVKRLLFVVCGSSQPASLSKLDIGMLKSFRVTMAVWRAKEGGKRVVAHSVIPQLSRDEPADPNDLDVVFVDQAAATDPLDGWLETVQANSAALSSLLGLGLGLDYLEQGEGPAAKLVLCKSRKDLERAFGTLLRPAKLDELLGTLLGEAEQKIAAGKARPSAELQQRIKAACAA